MVSRAALLLSLALLWSGCHGCDDIGCQHPLSVDVSTPSEISVTGVVSMEVEYDGERRSISCDGQECTISCPDAECPDGPPDISVSDNRDEDGAVIGIEFAIGHMSERARDGESSCRGVEDVTIDVTIGETVFERIELLGLSYERNDGYGGPGCGVADRREAAFIPLQPA